MTNRKLTYLLRTMLVVLILAICASMLAAPVFAATVTISGDISGYSDGFFSLAAKNDSLTRGGTVTVSKDGEYIKVVITADKPIVGTSTTNVTITNTSGNVLNVFYGTSTTSLTTVEVARGENVPTLSASNGSKTYYIKYEIAPETFTATFAATTNGSYTVDSYNVSSNYVPENKKNNVSAYTLVATPTSDAYEFGAWISNKRGVLSSDASFSYICAEDETVYAMFKNAGSALYYVPGDTSGTYGYVHLDLAQVAAAKSDKTIIVASSGFVGTSDGSQMVNIDSGVTLLLPYAVGKTSVGTSTYTDDSGYMHSTWENANVAFTSDNYDDGTDNNESVKGVLEPNTNVYVTLTIPSGTTVNINSGCKLVIGGTIVSGTHGTTGMAGAPAGAHSNLEVNGTLNINTNGILSVCGYILGTGNVNIVGGSVFQPFTMVDYHDGHHSVNTTKNGTFPANRYTMQCIQSPLTISSGGRMYAYIDIYTQATSGTVLGLTVRVSPRHNVECVIVIGTYSDECLIRLEDGAIFSSTYDATDFISNGMNSGVLGYADYAKVGKTKITIIGGATMGKLKMTITVAGSDYPLDSSTCDFPIPYHYDFNLQNGTYTIPYNISLLPGATMTVAEDADLVISGGRFTVFDGLRDYTSRNQASNPVKKGSWYEYHYPSTTDLQNDHSKKTNNGTANFIVDGTFTVQSGASFGGYIQTNGTGTITMNGTASVTAGVGNVIGYGTPVNAYGGRSERTLQAWIYLSNGQRIALKTGGVYRGVDNSSHKITDYSYRVFTTADDKSVYFDETVTLDATITGSWQCTNHSYTSIVTTAPTCTATGVRTYTCVCGHSYTEVEAALGHKEAAAVKENVIKPTCTADGSREDVIYCSECKVELSRTTVVDTATGHNYTSVVTAPTCTKQGYTTHTCSKCNDSYVDTYVAATGHNYEAVVTAPTCTEDGYTTYTCACGDTYVADETAATGHNYEAVVTAPTCTKAGYTTYTCACGDTYVADEVAATGHTYTSAETKAPTCTEAGVMTYTCACGDTYTEEIAANGHTLTQVEAKAPTCTEAGYEAYEFCSACDYTTFAEVAATDHNYTGAETKAPTCTEDGVMTYTCKHDASHTYTEEIAAKGHTLTSVEAKAPTCTEAGYEAYEFCSACDYTTFAEVAATGHNYTSAETKAPTCTEAGVMTYTCACGDSYTEVITATGHKYDAVVTAPTCTAGGYTTYTCACGDTYVSDETAATGHNYEAVVTAPTCTEAGYTTEKCTACGITTTRDHAAALGHKFSNYAVNGDMETAICDRGCSAKHSRPVQQNNDTVTVVPGTESDTAANVTVDTNALAGMADGNLGLQLDSDILDLLFDSNAVKNIVNTHTGKANVTIAVDKKPATENSGLIFDIYLKVDGHKQESSSFGDGSVTVTIPLGDLELTNHQTVKVWYIQRDESGEIVNRTDMGGKHDRINGHVMFQTNHFSEYELEVVAHEHSYEGTITTAPTCTEAGVKTYSCACGESYSEAIAATGHNYENGVCTGCGDKKVTGSFTKSTRSLSLAEYVYINQYVYIEGFDGIDLTVYGGIISWIGEIDEDDAVVGNDALTIRAGLVLDQKTGRYAQQSAVIWANQYGKTVYMRFYVQLEDGTYVYSDIYSDSVVAYCQAAFASTKVSHDNKQAYAAMLYYGAAAQVQFDHATTGLVSDYIPQEYANKPEWDESRIDALRAVPSYSTIATSDLVIRRSNTLSMVEAVGLNCYFYVHESISVKSAQLIIWNGSVSELTLKNTAYVVDMDKVASKKAGYTSYAQQSELIYANRLGDTMFISARIEAEDGTVYYSEPFAYSPEFYASTAWAASSVSADSKELAMCMVWYGECVKKLFG